MSRKNTRDLFSGEDFGGMVKRLRKYHGLTQREFGDRIHAHQAAVSAWEKGKHVPSKTVKEAIYVAFVQPQEGVSDAGEEYNDPRREKLVRDVKEFAKKADLDLVDALSKNVKAFKELMHRRIDAPREIKNE